VSLAEDLERDGFVVVRNLFDPLLAQMQVADLVALAGGGREIVAAMTLRNARVSPVVYEGAKQLPAILYLTAAGRNLRLIDRLRPGFMPGIAEGGVQVRADMPNDEKWRTHAHQDGTFQGRSTDGLTFWTPLLPVTPDMGPLEIAVGSHKGGLLPIQDVGPGHARRERSYTWEIDDSGMVETKYEMVAPLTEPGDVIVMDYRTIHRSGRNTSAVPRWSALWRYFDYRKGVEMGWKRPAQFGPQSA
jgi:hypothetical protein